MEKFQNIEFQVYVSILIKKINLEILFEKITIEKIREKLKIRISNLLPRFRNLFGKNGNILI